MSAYSGGSGADIFGNAIDTAPVSAEFAGLWPPGALGAAAPGHKEQPSRTLVQPAPATPGGERPAARPVSKPKRKKRKKADDGGDQPPGGEMQQKRTIIHDAPAEPGGEAAQAAGCEVTGLSGLPGELARTLRDIAHYETELARQPGSARTQALLDHERDHAERIRATMRATGMPAESR